MPQGSMQVSLSNYAALCKDLQAMNGDATKAIQRTVSDFKSRAPAWIGAAVTEEYTIKKSEVKGALTGAKKIGSIKVSGVEVDNIGLEYSGRPLTPTHFKMKPKKPSVKREKEPRLIPGENTNSDADVVTAFPIKAYNVTAEIHKGQAKSLGSDVFPGSNGGAGYIPFQRTGDSRTPIKSIKTVSVPQMITNEKVAATIQKNIEEGMTSRLEHHIQQAMGK